MNPLVQLFSKQKKNILNIYFTAGFPIANSTKCILEALNNTQTDIIEIGIPFSDPLADGPTIQNSNQQAIKMGVTTDNIFDDIIAVKESISKPYVLMGYYNTLLSYGLEQFFVRAKEANVSGMIFPDMPLREFKTQLKPYFEQYDICPIFLITPETSLERIKEFEKISQGFLYLVSSSSTTGSNTQNAQNKSYLSFFDSYQPNKPVLVGFGVKTQEDFTNICKKANGAIIGSAFINHIRHCKNVAQLQEAIKRFIYSIKPKDRV